MNCIKFNVKKMFKLLGLFPALSEVCSVLAGSQWRTLCLGQIGPVGEHLLDSGNAQTCRLLELAAASQTRYLIIFFVIRHSFCAWLVHIANVRCVIVTIFTGFILLKEGAEFLRQKPGIVRSDIEKHALGVELRVKLLDDLLLMHITHKLGDVVLGRARRSLVSPALLSLMRLRHLKASRLLAEMRSYRHDGLGRELDQGRWGSKMSIRHGLRHCKAPWGEGAVRLAYLWVDWWLVKLHLLS